MINLDDFTYFSRKRSLKILSRNGDSYMTESDLIAISFDKAKEKYAREYSLEIMPTSNDALFQLKNRIFFVEFKDGNIGYELQKDGCFRLDNIERKIYDSLFLFCDMTKQHVSDTRQYLTYILVYNHENSEKYMRGLPQGNRERLESNETQYSISYEKIMNHVGRHTSLGNPDLFGLRKRVSALYFSEILFFEKEAFSAFLANLRG